MQISLPAELERFVLEQVESGEYLAPGEVIVDALWLLQDDCELRKIRRERLRRAVQQGIEQLEAGEYRVVRGENLETFVSDLKAEARRRLDTDPVTPESRQPRDERWDLLHGPRPQPG